MIYLDHNATTAVLPEVFEAMRPFFCEEWGNPSSSYRFGSKLKKIIERSRSAVSDLIGAQAREIVFTSCGTESNNTAIHSAVMAYPQRKHVITSQVEHSSVLAMCRSLETLGFRVTYLPVSGEGLLSLSDLEEAITDQTALVSLMWANNETGVFFPVEEISKLCRSRDVLFHCDAVQAVGKIPVNVNSLQIDYLSLSGHKLNGPKGIGALYVSRSTKFHPLIYGGHQERGRRGGTENVALIAGFGEAAKIAKSNIQEYDLKVRRLRDLLENEILNCVAGSQLNGHREKRMPNVTNISFAGIESEALLLLLDQSGVCASSGSACLADTDEPSHVVRAMKPGGLASRQMIRFSLGVENSDQDVERAIQAIRKSVSMLS